MLELKTKKEITALITVSATGEVIPLQLLYEGKNEYCHQVPSVLMNLDEANNYHVFIPPNCTDRLQPLDVAINKPMQSFMKEKFILLYSSQVQEQLHSGERIDEVKMTMILSVMKNVKCSWIVEMIDHIKHKSDIIINGFSQPGILDAIHSHSVDADSEEV